MDLAWMQWTPQTLGIFAGVILTLTLMTIWDVRSPSVRRKGFLVEAQVERTRQCLGMGSREALRIGRDLHSQRRFQPLVQLQAEECPSLVRVLAALVDAEA